VEGEIAAIIRRSTELFSAGDIDGLVALHADDAEVEPASEFVEGGPLKGTEAVRRFYRDLFEGLENTVVVEKELFELDDSVGVYVFEWRATGAVSGIETSSEWIAVFELKDGRITRVRFFGARAEVLAALGLEAWPAASR
jgi:ketosteroid isomerase-like protein